MKFDAYAFLAKLEAEGGSGEAAPPPPKMEPAPRVAHVARVARPLPQNPRIEPEAAKPADPPQPAPEAFPYGVGITGTAAPARYGTGEPGNGNRRTGARHEPRPAPRMEAQGRGDRREAGKPVL